MKYIIVDDRKIEGVDCRHRPHTRILNQSENKHQNDCIWHIIVSLMHAILYIICLRRMFAYPENIARSQLMVSLSPINTKYRNAMTLAQNKMWSNRDDHRYSKHCQCPSAWPLERCPSSYTTHSAESNIANGIYGPLLQLNLTFSVGHTEWQRKNRKKNNNRRKCRELVLKHHVAVGNCTRSATPWNACVNTKIARRNQ